MVYFLCGEERFLINKRCDELISELGINNIIKYDMEEYSFTDVLSEVYTIDLFNERKLVIVSNFSFKCLSSREEEGFFKFLSEVNDNVILIKCADEKLDERKKIVKLLRDKKCIFEFKKLMYSNLENYVFDYFKSCGYKVSLDVVKKLVKKLENNSNLVFNELDKLMMYKYDEKVINSCDIDDVVMRNYEKELFAFSNAVMNKEIGDAFNCYKKLMNMNIEISVLVDYLSKQFRTLYQIKNINGSFYDISKKLDVNEYVIKILYNSINIYSDEEILNILCKLYDIDEGIKIYGYDKNKIFENFIISLC